MLALLLLTTLTLAVSTAWLPVPAAQAATTVYYLKDNGSPQSSLSTSAPSSGTLRDVDSDGDPGRTLKRSDKGWTETDSSKYHLFVSPANGMTISGSVQLKVWAAIEDFEDDEEGELDAFLLDCNFSGGGCSLVDQASAQWDDVESFTAKTLDFGTFNHTISPGRKLALKLVVDEKNSDEEMWIAFDTTSYPASLSLSLATAPTTTTTTVAPTTTTTAAPTTTTTVAPTTTTTAGSITTTTPTTTTPTTTLLATTTTTIGSSTTQPPTSGGGGGPAGPSSPEGRPLSGPTGTPRLFEDVAGDPAAVPLGATAPGPSESRVWPGALIEGLALVIPPWAVNIVASPLLILGFVFNAMTDSGRAVMLPLSLLMVGGVWVVFENRALGFGWLRHKQREGEPA